MIVECPICGSEVNIDIEFAKKNGRVFCGSCCRAFDIELKEKDEEDEYSDDGWYYGD